MKLNKFLTEQLTPKVKLEAPSKVLNLLNALIVLEKDPLRRKRLQELKGILVGKYPNPQALFNSLNGLNKKLSSINEVKLNRRQKIGIGLLAALMAITTLIMPTVKAAVNKPVGTSPKEKVEAPISDVEAKVLSIGVRQEVWDKIYNELQDYLKKLAEAEYQGREAHAELAKIFKKYNISFASLGQTTAGAYIPETNKVRLNWSTLIRLATGDITLDKAFGTLRHEMAHRAQFEMLKKLLSDEKYRNFIRTEMARSYVRRIIEIGAHHDEFKRMIENLNKEQLAGYLSKQSQNIIKNIVLLYPDNDPVVSAIYETQPSLKNLMTKLSQDESMEKMKIAKDMVAKYQGIFNLIENKKIEENNMEWKEMVKEYLYEADPDRRREGGYKAMATRLSSTLGKTITPLQVKSYLEKMEQKKMAKNIKSKAKAASAPDAYEWGAKFKILKNHFS